MLDDLIEKAATWIASQRDAHRPSACPLGPGIRSAMAPFFEDEILDAVRVRVVPSIENPDFYPEVETKYQVKLPDFSEMHGITHHDTILLRDGVINRSLIFHELVHVTQYSILGIAEFAKRYVTGWAENGREYENIPLEQDAYDLEDRYREGPGRPFSVLDEVKRQLA